MVKGMLMFIVCIFQYCLHTSYLPQIRFLLCTDLFQSRLSNNSPLKRHLDIVAVVLLAWSDFFRIGKLKKKCFQVMSTTSDEYLTTLHKLFFFCFVSTFTYLLSRSGTIHDACPAEQFSYIPQVKLEICMDVEMSKFDFNVYC